MGQAECFLAKLLVKISFGLCFDTSQWNDLWDDRKRFFFPLVDPENLVRAAGDVIPAEFSHTALAFHAMCTAMNCPSALLFLLCQGKGPGTGPQAIPKEGFPLPWAPV